MPEKILISASRRTDIPAFYMDWFMEGIGNGFFSVKNPYNQRISTVPAAPDAVHTIIFWSKNFARFIDDGYGETLLRLGYHLYFQFTINCENRILEPNIPPLYERLNQANALCRAFGPDAVSWRFDPVCVYETAQTGRVDNTDCLDAIAKTLSNLGIRRCVTSFVDLYPKIARRTRQIPEFSFSDLSISEKQGMLSSMKRILNEHGIKLLTCCEKDVMESLLPGSGIEPGACIDHNVLSKLYGPGLNMQKDRGQRRSKGCGCMAAKDIGDYTAQPCFHNCLFCYANPVPHKRIQKR